MYIIQRIAECISENLRRDPLWPVVDYANICRAVMTIKKVPDYMQRQIMRDAATEGYDNYYEFVRTGRFTYHNGCQQHPEILIGETLDRLVSMLADQQGESA